MKIFIRVLLFAVLIAVVSGAIYYFSTYSKTERKSLLAYLDQNSVAFHSYNTYNISRIISFINQEQNEFDALKFLNDSSQLKKNLDVNGGIVSWHMTRQNELAKVLWIKVNDSFTLEDDTLIEFEKINDVFQINTQDRKLFLAKSKAFVAIGGKGEIIEALSAFDFYDGGLLNVVQKNKLQGSWKHLQNFLKNKSDVFAGFDIQAKNYVLDFDNSSDVVFYNLTLDSVAHICPGSGLANFNGSLPISTVAVWQSDFSDNQCIFDKHTKKVEQKLWEIEERYQIKISTLLEAWFDGSFRNVFCDFNGVFTHFAVVKLNESAAPFASGSRFFVDYENLSIGNDMPQKQFTVARVIPEGLVKAVFPNDENAKSLFVTQYKDHLYFAKKREGLVLLLNELITGNRMEGFDQMIPALHHYFFKYPKVFNYKENISEESGLQEFLVQGKSLLMSKKILFQGQVILPTK
jgi:hypothetical protein